MKITYFLRGLGVGIIFCALIMLMAVKTAPDTMTDEEVVSRAKELGMVEGSQSDAAIDALCDSTEETENDKNKDNSDKAVDSTTTEGDTTSKQVTTEAATTEAATTETATTEAATTEVKKNSKDDKKKPDDDSKVTITNTKGMYSERVSEALAAKGVIDDAAAFNKYLESNGYADSLVVGTYTLKKGEDYSSVVAKITGH